MEQQRTKSGGPRGIKGALAMKGIKDVGDDAIDLMQKLLTIDPSTRISA